MKFPDLQDLSGEFAEEARRYYCGTTGRGVRAPAGTRAPPLDRRNESKARSSRSTREKDSGSGLIRADLFEQVLQSRYLGSKRFSLEGNTSLIPLLDSILDAAGDLGGIDSLMAMSHRGPA